MLKNDILFVGVGQCGGNITQELEKLNFNSYYINSSLEDLDTIVTDISNKYHIPKTKGMAKDREYALEVLGSNDNLPNITNKIYENFSNCKIVYFVLSLGGGTGGTMGGILAHDYAEAFPEKIVNVIAVLPSSNEDMLIQANAVKSLNQIIQSYKDGYITNVQILDNDKKDNKEQILKMNSEFAHLMNSLISFDNISKIGNLDSEEMERILTCRGFMSAIQFKEESFDVGLTNANERSIYADWLKSSSIQGYVLNQYQDNDTNKQLINEVFGIPKTTYYSTWDNENNIIFSLSDNFNDNIITKLKRTFSELANKRAKIEQEAQDQINNNENNALDVDFSVVDMSITRRTPRTPRTSVRSEIATTAPSSEPPMQRRTSRRREGVSSALNSLRSMK